MRILTHSPSKAKGLISIDEAEENVPQTVIFCIPIDIREAEQIRSIRDFENRFSNGIVTKIIEREETNIIELNFELSQQIEQNINLLPKFVANVKGFNIDFFLSPLNFLDDKKPNLKIDFFYSGNNHYDQFINKRLVILEPDWRELDKLFLEEGVIFTDWE